MNDYSCGCLLVADILYMNNLQTGSVLDYTLTYLHAILSRSREKWDLPPKSGLIEITLSREYHRLYSGLQYVSLCNLSPILHLPVDFVSPVFTRPEAWQRHSFGPDSSLLTLALILLHSMQTMMQGVPPSVQSLLLVSSLSRPYLDI